MFPDDLSVDDQLALRQIVDAWQAVHVPSLGSPIAQSGTTVTKDGAGELLEPATNTVYQIQAISLTNSGGAAPVVATPQLNGVPFISTDQTTIAPSSTVAIKGPWNIDKNLPMSIVVASGTASDLSTTIWALKLSQ